MDLTIEEINQLIFGLHDRNDNLCYKFNRALTGGYKITLNDEIERNNNLVSKLANRAEVLKRVNKHPNRGYSWSFKS